MLWEEGGWIFWIVRWEHVVLGLLVLCFVSSVVSLSVTPAA